MNDLLDHIKAEIYSCCNLTISDFFTEQEGQEYHACTFKINDQHVICRNAKITPKKVGQFVTFWKRNKNNITEPFDDSDQLSYYIVNVKSQDKRGQFVLPKSILKEKGIITTKTKEGKRGFRVYPSWDITSSKQAMKTQQWQCKYFYTLDKPYPFELIKRLFGLAK